MTHYGIEAIAAQRIQERHDEADRARLAKSMSAGTKGRGRRIHLPAFLLRRSAPSAHTA